MNHTKFTVAVLFTMITMHTEAQVKKPNIILVLADDVGYKSLQCDGGNLYSTPNIDALAQNGMRFTQCHASPMCSPSRFMLLTGKYNFRNYTEWGVMYGSQQTIGNLFRDAGYKTACFGKWQLDGGDASIRTLGFDDYTVHDAWDEPQKLSRYKNPHIYTRGAFLPDSLTKGKYGPDIVSDSILNFITKNKSNPFFIYYPLILVHGPFQPTPDDTAYAHWEHGGDTSFFPSMMHYMDKEVGRLIARLKALHIEKNTVILFSGDNGTSNHVGDYADENDSLVKGGKRSTTEAGTHVPFIVYWPGTVKPGTVNKDLIDFTDLLPSLAGIANIPVPANYGSLDGVSFAPRLFNQAGTPRDWIFNSYDPYPGHKNYPSLRWAQNKMYKLYDTSSINDKRLFYNIISDPEEKNPIPDGVLTGDETSTRQQLLHVIDGYVEQAAPIFTNSVISKITDSSAFMSDFIQINGGSAILASGAVWDTKANPVISSSPHSSNGPAMGLLQASIKQLMPNRNYYIRAYATNVYGTTYGPQIKFRTSITPPVAGTAISVHSNEFNARWRPVAGINLYKLDVSSYPTFARINPGSLKEGFNGGVAPPDGWTFSTNIDTNKSSFGKQAPSVEFNAFDAQITTKKLGGPATELKFWVKGINTNSESALLIEGFDGNTWTVIKELNLSLDASVIKFNDTTATVLSPNFIQFRFTYKKSWGTVIIDDVSIKYKNVVPVFVPGYDNLTVTDTTAAVKGLAAKTRYYYRVRAVSNDNISNNSNVIAVTIRPPGFTSNDSCNIRLAKEDDTFKVVVFPNPVSDAFSINVQSKSSNNIEIIITDINGRKVYQANGNNYNNYVIRKEFSPGVYFIKVVQGQNIKAVKLIKQK